MYVRIKYFFVCPLIGSSNNLYNFLHYYKDISLSEIRQFQPPFISEGNSITSGLYPTLPSRCCKCFLTSTYKRISVSLLCSLDRKYGFKHEQIRPNGNRPKIRRNNGPSIMIS